MDGSCYHSIRAVDRTFVCLDYFVLSYKIQILYNVDQLE